MSNEDAMQELLRQVASGDVSPEEATERIAALQKTAVAVEEPPVGRVRVTGLVHPTKIVGDSQVRDVSVQGPHRAAREGDAMVVRGMPLGEEGGWFSFRWPEKLPFGTGSGQNPLRPVLIRMNPQLPLEVEMAAGLLTVEGIRGPIKADIQAGSARVEGFSEAIDLNVTWGTVSVRGLLNQGASRIRCEAGTVKVRLEHGSSVRVVARSTLGKISLPGDGAGLADGWTMGGDLREVTIGEGSGHLEIDATTGAVWVEEV
ncbi:MAG TPA: hypothetical protein VNF75_05275 [Candidatus Dormibacteraeota bacterium]|nr:hypothetical protein [Candidatus Dormibacteraeota bacterium]